MKTVSLASGHVSSTDVLSIEEIRPDTHPAKIIIKWPPRAHHCRAAQLPEVRFHDHEDLE
jgi:hypothetical protein